VLKTLFPDELQLGLAQATVAALAALLVVVAARRRGGAPKACRMPPHLRPIPSPVAPDQ
jgi:hypothetical protein